MENRIIGLAADHAGYEMKEMVKTYLKEKGYEVKDFGAHSPERSDFPDFAHPMGNAVSKGEIKTAMSFCGSGNGINIAMNRHKGVRSAYCWNPEIARLARQHNNANVCAIPARFLEPETVREIIDAFLTADFEGGRHQRRVDKIDRD